MPTTPNATWLQQFAAHLIEVRPWTAPLDAVRYGVAAFPRADALDPIQAAERIAESASPGQGPGWPVAIGPVRLRATSRR